MLRMRRSLAVERNNGPFIAQGPRFGRAEIQHWFDREAISRTDPLFCACTAIVGYLRRFVHMPANAVPGVIANDPVTVLLAMLLNGPADIANAIADSSGLNAQFQAFLGDADQLLELVGDLADRQRHGRIADKSVVRRRHVQRDDVAVL